MAAALSAATPPRISAVAGVSGTARMHQQTTWQVRTSVVYEAFGLLNALTGDPLAAAQYPADTARFGAGLTPRTQTALERLSTYRQQSGTALSALLARNFSAANPASLDEAIALANDPGRLRRALAGEVTRQEWYAFAAVLPDVAAALEHLRGAGFEAYWQEQLLPGLTVSAGETQAFVQNYNVVPVVEQYLGRALPGSSVTLYLVYFQRPYGHRLTGTQLVSVPGISPEAQVQTVIHELLHPAFDSADADVRRAAQRLAGNAFFRQAFEQRDTRYPYNTWSSYVDENAVRALEQMICAQMGLPQRWSWAGEDGGMHVLAPVLVDLMRAQNYPASGESFETFFLRNIGDGTLLSLEQATAIYDRQVVQP